MLWQYKGRDPVTGREREYQLYGPDIAPASMLAVVRQHVRNLIVTEPPVPVPQSAYRPPTGIIERHLISFGVIEEVEKELGLAKPSGGILAASAPLRDRLHRDAKPLARLIDTVSPLTRRR